jgi:hypothetical protein
MGGGRGGSTHGESTTTLVCCLVISVQPNFHSILEEYLPYRVGGSLAPPVAVFVTFWHAVTPKSAHLRWTGNGCPIENPLPVLGRSWLLPHGGVLTEEPQNQNAKRVNKMTWMMFICFLYFFLGVPPWLSWLRKLPYSTSEQEVQNKLKLLPSDACQPREFKCRSIAGWWQNLCHEELVALFHGPSLA